MKTLKRWIKNFKWLFNHPPTDLILSTGLIICDYCKQEPDGGSWTTSHGTICYACQKKVYDSVLKEVSE